MGNFYNNFKEFPMHYVYHIRDKNMSIEEGYVGVTKNLESRFYDHTNSKYIVGKAIRKHNLSFEDMHVIVSFENEEDAYKYEAELRPKSKMGWNLSFGGLGGDKSEFTDYSNHSAMFSGENNPYYGVKHDDDIREKISKRLLEKSEEWRKSNASNAGKGNKGKKRSERRTKEK